MPLYDYTCLACKHHFEKMKLMKDREEPETEPCPACGKKKVKQFLPSAPGLHSGGVYKKPDSGFREVLAKIAQHHPRHNIGHWMDRK